ncbi:myo-inosose-2 dehydratase [Benzoatithermus flavus]|uniref:Myo-inosose-2 dehydratase n=1 Tax=Benzoatithermus flavus TaxID=3108223 RepID=A0ABU8XLM8_9PROT
MGIVKIGTNPIAWSNDDMPELGGDTPLETCLNEARSIGFTGIELGNKFPREPAALRRVLESHGLSLVSGWYGAELRKRTVEQEIEAMTPHLELLAALQAPVMVFCETSDTVQNRRNVPLRDRPVMREEEWGPFIEKLVAVAEHMNARGVRMAYHHHMGTVIEKAHEIDRLMESTPAVVGLLYDTGHLTFAGEDPAVVAKRWAHRIVHVHAKDVRADVKAKALAEGWSFLDSVVEGVYTVPGDGCIDFRAALRPIAEADYSGWLVVEAEQDPAKANPLTYGTMGYQNLRAIATELGFTVHN